MTFEPERADTVDGEYRSPAEIDADLLMDLVGTLPGLFAWHVEHPAALISEVAHGLGYRLFGWWGTRPPTTLPDEPTPWVPHLAWRSPTGGWAAATVDLHPGADLPPWNDCDWAPRLNMLNSALLTPFGHPSSLVDVILGIAGQHLSVSGSGTWRHQDPVIGPLLWGLLRLLPPADRATTRTLLALSRPDLLTHVSGDETIGVREYTGKRFRTVED
jgi:hypothetical protein